MIKETQKGLKCCSERHLLKSALAIAVYNKIGAITNGGKNGATYYTTLEPLADLFGVEPNSVWRVVAWMCKIGFLEKMATTNGTEHQLRADCFQSKSYRYVSHQEWADHHPGNCYEALDPNWDELGDPLARELWQVSRGNTRWYVNQLACLRNAWKVDAAITQQWNDYLAELDKPCVYRGQWKAAQGKFLRLARQIGQSDVDKPGEE